MVYAQLEIGQGNSGKLVTAIRQDARQVADTEHKSWILIDGPPGIGCPVIAAIGGVDLALIVIEPTVSGVHDFERVMSLIDHFKITAAVCVNRYDLNEAHTQAIVEHATEHNVSIVGRIPSDDAVTAAQMEGVSLIEYAPESPAADAIRHAHVQLECHLQERV
jgi:MinD superfamily P-loop ATPase